MPERRLQRGVAANSIHSISSMWIAPPYRSNASVGTGNAVRSCRLWQHSSSARRRDGLASPRRRVRGGARRKVVQDSKRDPSSRCSAGWKFFLGAGEIPRLPMVARDRHPSWDVWLTIRTTRPLFCVSAESKGLSSPVSALYATLTGGFISVDSSP